MGTFRFEHRWRLRAPADVVYAALADVESYPLWWPQVRGIRRVDDRSGHAYVRSLLPYTLDLLLTREVQDPFTRTLRVSIAGDLSGWSQWRVHPAADGAEAHYEQEATVTTAGLERIVPVAAPLLRANHLWMMRAGERGFSAWVSGGPGAAAGGAPGAVAG